jgi:E3 ubiquitin-protein ligase RBBP6
MSCVHYKYKNSLDYDTITFDGLHITLNDLRQSIAAQKKLGKSSDFLLQVINAQTKEEYKGDNTLIPRNASVIVQRVPVAAK